MGRARAGRLDRSHEAQASRQTHVRAVAEGARWTQAEHLDCEEDTMTRALRSVVGVCALALATMVASAAAACPDGDGDKKGGTGLMCPKDGSPKPPAAA